MKGIVFVELLNMAENMLGESVVDAVIEACDLPSEGAYTAVGDYNCSELMALIQGFSTATALPGDALQRLFGQWMLKSFVRYYPDFFRANNGALSMLESIEGEVHVEVRKIYPNAELPTFQTHRPDQGSLLMAYSSPRALSSFCLGLIEGCLDHYDTKAEITEHDRSVPGLTQTDFMIKVAHA